MKKILALMLLFVTILPQVSFAAFNTQSADLELGSAQYFSRADTATLSITGSFAYFAWVKLESLPSVTGNVMPIVMKNDAGANRSTAFLLQGGGGTDLLSCTADQLGDNSDTSGVDYDWSADLVVDKWYKVGCSFNAGTGRIDLFIGDETTDMTSVANNTGTASAVFDGNASTYISFQGGTTRYFDGRIALVRVWSTTRSAAEYETADCTQLGTTANLAAEWTLDNTLNDNSGNANTLTNNNSATFGADVPAGCEEVLQPTSKLLINNGSVRINVGALRQN